MERECNQCIRGLSSVMVMHFKYTMLSSRKTRRRKKHCRKLFCIVAFLKMVTTTILTEKTFFFSYHIIPIIFFRIFLFWMASFVNEKKNALQWKKKKIETFTNHITKYVYTHSLCAILVYIYLISSSKSHMLILELVSFPFQSTYLSILTHNYVYIQRQERGREKMIKMKRCIKQRNIGNQQLHHCVYFWMLVLLLLLLTKWVAKTT